MSKWLAMAETAEEKPNTPPDIRTKPDKTPSDQPVDAFCQVLSNCQVEVEKKDHDLRPSPSGAENQETATSNMRHGFAINGNPKTWTGNVVSLSEWRGLSEWQRHGPNGRMWCGACRAWVSECEHTPEGSA